MIKPNFLKACALKSETKEYITEWYKNNNNYLLRTLFKEKYIYKWMKCLLTTFYYNDTESYM